MAPCRAIALSGQEHAADMQRIMPFTDCTENKAVFDFYHRINAYLDLPYTQPGQQPDKSQPKRPKLVVDHPKLSQIRWQGKHRIWYHWGFNTDPRQYPPLVGSLNQAVAEGTISQEDATEFWTLLSQDIATRNRALMNEAAQVFGYGELGTISAQQRRQLNGLITILYSIHILGDHQTPDSTIVAPLSRVYADISNAIDNLAGTSPDNLQQAKALKKKLKAAQTSPTQYLDTLALEFTPFLLSLRGEGYDYQARFQRMGYRLK